MRGKCERCGRVMSAISRGVCTTCESRIRRNKPLDTPVRSYSRKPRPFGPLESRLDKLLTQTKNRAWSLVELANELDSGPANIQSTIDALRSRGKNISLKDEKIILHTEIDAAPITRIDVTKFKGQKIKFGLTSDNHLCSKYARLDVLNALFDIWQGQGITTVYQLGNMIDGEASFNRHDLLIPPGMESQINYFLENWPRRKNITTHFITGDDHEGWYIRNYGVEIGKAIQYRADDAGRRDLKYLGHMEHDIELKAARGNSLMRLVHAGGGSAYATSYSVQKIVESYQGGEKPSILLVGHYHKAEYGYPREVHVIQAGCTQDQTPFMRKQKLQAHVGGWTISFELDGNGIIHAFTQQFHPFYDRSFYKKWGYVWRG